MNFTMFPIPRILFFFDVLLLLLLPFFGESNKSSLESDPFFNFLSAIDPKNVLNISSSNVIIGSSPCLVNLNTNNNNNNNGVIIIRCNKNGTNIVEIRLENLNLSGTIDADSLCKLQKLRALSLANNNIKGKIPHSILHCTRLMYLNLTRNQLSGNVPTRSLAKLKFLKKLDISNNNFIPIKHNKFSTYYVTPNIKDGTKGSIVNSSPQSSDDKEGSSSSSSSPIISMKLLIPLIIGLVILLVSLIFAAKKLPKLCREGIIKVLIRSHQVSPSSQKSITSDQMVKKGGLEDSPSSLGLVFFVEKEERFTMEDLLRAAADLRSESFCSSLYKVKLNNAENDVHYAVKRLKNVQVSCEDEFGETLRKISKLKHPNILPLVGYRSTSEEKLVIYKYQTNGSLLNLLNDYIAGRKHFPWKLRLSIACGIARGMAFIYRKKLNNNNKEEGEDDSIIPHGNLKPSNILLNENNEPLISEHGLTKFMDPNRSGFLLSSQGYTAPEKCISEKSDVYSFGVILLELLTGKSIEKTRIDLARWVRSMVREEWTGEVFDKSFGPNEHQWAFPILNVALTCVTRFQENRPTMGEILERIEEVMDEQEHQEQIASSKCCSNGSKDCCSLHKIIPDTWDSPGSNY